MRVFIIIRDVTFVILLTYLIICDCCGNTMEFKQEYFYCNDNESGKHAYGYKLCLKCAAKIDFGFQ